MLRVSVHSPVLRVQPYINKKGQAAELHLQTVYVHTVGEDGTPAPYPEKVEAFAERGPDGSPRPWPAGEYTLHPSAVYVDRNGRLAASVRLTPAPKRAAA